MKTLFNIFSCILILVFAWDRATRKYLNPYKLFFIFGQKGSGKTITETKLAVKYLSKGWLVYTDMPELMIPGVRLFEWQKLGDFVPEQNSLLLLGEVGTKFDKRDFKSFKPSLRDFFVFQRKYKVICYMDSQSYDVDVKIRDRCDGMFLMTNLFRVFAVGKRIYKKPQIVEASADAPSRIVENLKIAPLSRWMWTYIPRWVDLYDTDHIIDQKPYLDYTTVDALKPSANRRARAVARKLARGQRRREKHKNFSLKENKSASPVL